MATLAPLTYTKESNESDRRRQRSWGSIASHWTVVARCRSASTVPPGTASRFFEARWISLNSGMESSLEVRPPRQFRNFDLAEKGGAYDTES